MKKPFKKNTNSKSAMKQTKSIAKEKKFKKVLKNPLATNALRRLANKQKLLANVPIKDTEIEKVLTSEEKKQKKERFKKESQKQKSKKAKPGAAAKDETSATVPQLGQSETSPEEPAKPKDSQSNGAAVVDNEEKPHAYDASDNPKTIFVGNVAANTKKQQLKVFFEEYGKVKSIRIRTTHGEKVFNATQKKKAEALNAYVVFADESMARNALAANGRDFKGQHIRVNKSTDKSELGDAKRTVYVGNLKYSVTDEKLHDLFKVCGEIEYVRTLRSELGCTGSAFVCFKKPESVMIALELNENPIDNRPMKVTRYSSQKKANKNRNGKSVQGAGKKGKSATVKNTSSKKKASDTKANASFVGEKSGTKKKKSQKLSKSNKSLAKKIAPRNSS